MTDDTHDSKRTGNTNPRNVSSVYVSVCECLCVSVSMCMCMCVYVCVCVCRCVQVCVCECGVCSASVHACSFLAHFNKRIPERYVLLLYSWHLCSYIIRLDRQFEMNTLWLTSGHAYIRSHTTACQHKWMCSGGKSLWFSRLYRCCTARVLWQVLAILATQVLRNITRCIENAEWGREVHHLLFQPWWLNTNKGVWHRRTTKLLDTQNDGYNEAQANKLKVHDSC